MTLRRNLIIVVAHGLRSDTAGDTQHWPYVAPNIETLCNRGMRVAAVSACPADVGGMVSLLTGMHARQHGYVQATDQQVSCEGFPHWLAAAGYHVAGVGCVGLFEGALHRQILVEPLGKLDPGRCAYAKAMREKGYYAAIRQQRQQRLRYGPFDPERLLLEPGDDVDGFITAQARAMLADMPTDRPWALIVAYTGPGNDLPPPGLYDQLLDPYELGAGFSPADFRSLDVLAELDYPRILLQRLEREQVGRIRADYLGRVSLIDHGVGRLMAHLGRRSDRGRTWFVVASDRGQLLGENGLVGHRSFLAGALEVPVIVSPPSVARPGSPAREKIRNVDGLASSVDVAATIAELGGCDMPASVAGRSLLKAFREDKGHDDQTSSGAADQCISEFGRRLMLETHRHKIIFDTDTRKPIGLYDLRSDELENQNLVDTPAGWNLLDAMRWRLADSLMPLRTTPAMVGTQSP